MMKTKMSNNYEILADRILKFPGLLSKYNYVEVVESSCEEGDWEDNPDIADENGSTRKELSKEYYTETEEWKHYFKSMDTACKVYMSEILGLEHEGFIEKVEDESRATIHFSKYRVGGMVKPHTDEGYTEDNGYHTIIWYLNDDYEGGELGFTEQNLKIKAEPGDVFIYPSYFEHYGEPVTSGTKYIAIFRDDFSWFLKDKPPTD